MKDSAASNAITQNHFAEKIGMFFQFLHGNEKMQLVMTLTINRGEELETLFFQSGAFLRVREKEKLDQLIYETSHNFLLILALASWVTAIHNTLFTSEAKST